jgi:hypothetical protein
MSLAQLGNNDPRALLVVQTAIGVQETSDAHSLFDSRTRTPRLFISLLSQSDIEDE